ncbi:MAG: hypothetical protein AB2L07_05875 [Thermoanaerobaculaceae bacterium]
MAKKDQSASTPIQPPAEQPTPAAPVTSVLTQLGWLLLVLSAVPLLMAAHGDGRPYLWTGLGLLLVGGVLLVAARIKQSLA